MSGQHTRTTQRHGRQSLSLAISGANREARCRTYQKNHGAQRTRLTRPDYPVFSAQLECIPSSPVVQVAVHDFRRDPRHFHVTSTFPRCRRLSLYTRAVLGRQTLLILVVVNKPCLSYAPVSSHLLQSILFHHPSLFNTQCPTSCSSTTATLSFGTRGNGTRIIPELRRP